MRLAIMGPSISLSTLLNCVIFYAWPLFEPQWFLRFSSRCLLSPIHQRQHTSAPPESNSQCRTQFHSLADPVFQLYSTMCIILPKTHMHTQTMGGTVLIAFCTALKGWPPASCSPSIGFIMVALHPTSCCVIPETYFWFSWLLCEHSPACSTLNLSPYVHLSCHQRSLCYFTSTQRPASCLYTCPKGLALHRNSRQPLSSKHL